MTITTVKWIRILLGVFLIGYALNQFLHVVPTSYGTMPEFTRQFLDSVVMYLPYLYVFEILIGALLVANKWTGMVLIMLFPLSFGFLMFNFINGDILRMIPALLVALLNLILIVARKDQYKMLLD